MNTAQKVTKSAAEQQQKRIKELEDAFSAFEGGLIEPIENSGHEDLDKTHVIEVNMTDVGGRTHEYPRIIGYGCTYQEALIDAHDALKRNDSEEGVQND